MGMAALLALLAITAGGAVAEDKPVSALFETSRLEAVKARRALNDDERETLAGLYFIHGDCTRVRDVYADARQPQAPLGPADQDLLCACDGKCDIVRLTPESRLQQKLHAFRALSALHGPLGQDTQVRSLWAELRRHPEGKHAAYAKLRRSSKASDRAEALRLWRELRPLNVENP